jgi:thiol-disulfide isomerase/thioredoxin
VTPAALQTVGAGSAQVLAKATQGDAPLTANGKPELLYIGAEFCPYCAAERWSMAVALSRFGTLNNVKLTQSASNDAYPNTATLDFVDTTYDSKYLSFTPIENEDRDHKPLEPVSKAQNALWGKYTAVLGAKSQGYPFLDFGNKYAFEGPTFLPTSLAHLTQAQIAAKLASPTDPAAKDINGSANMLTAAICGMTNNQPANVCTSKTISGIKAQIDGLNKSAPGSSQ